jgi:alpha-N-acetylglucosamine transferase
MLTRCVLETWAESFTKLLAFNQTQYARVLSLDSDSVLLQHMDELFLLPPTPVAMPRAYWLYPETKVLSSQVMLVQPSAAEFKRVMARVAEAKGSDYDMEIVNYLYGDSALVLPHRPYDMLSSELREKPDGHARYLGNEGEAWDPRAVFEEAKFVHFSDWPVPKPWLDIEKNNLKGEKQPECFMRDGKESCVEREMWNGLYDEFRERRKVSGFVSISLLVTSFANRVAARVWACPG